MQSQSDSDHGFIYSLSNTVKPILAVIDLTLNYATLTYIYYRPIMSATRRQKASQEGHITQTTFMSPDQEVSVYT